MLDDNVANKEEPMLPLTCENMFEANPELYPFIPFTEEEMKTLSYQEKLSRRQIPADILHQMTTKSLVYQFISCDLSGSMYLYNSVQTGFTAIAKN
jgi:hypothetical protein